MNLSGALEESGDKLMLLENLLNEKDSKLSELVSEVMELRDSSSWLANELESMISLNEKLTSQLNDDDNDYDEGHDNDSRLHLRQLGLASQRKRSQLVEQLKELRLRTQGRLKANEFLTSNNRRHLSGSLRRLRRRQSTAAAAAASLATSGDSASLSDELDCDTTKQVNKPANSDSASESDYQPDELIREIYALLRRFQAALQLRKDHFQQHQTSQQLVYSPNSPDDSGISADDGKCLPVEQRPLSLRRGNPTNKVILSLCVQISRQARLEPNQRLGRLEETVSLVEVAHRGNG